MDYKHILLQLVNADDEDEVISILKRYKLWDDDQSWKPYGGIENNFSSIGNQQSRPDAALVEKLVNSVDAVLVRECLRRNIDPESPSAPSSVQEAVKDFFGVYGGTLTNISSSERSSIAKNIGLMATGDKKSPSYTIIDRGEGQSPSNLEDTFLSLNRSNKMRIQFVQGKHNMGGTGALQFCGDKNIQLILSKRDPEIAKNESQIDRDSWGFTIVRRVDPRENMRSSSFMYLAPYGEIPSFKSDDIKLYPSLYPDSTGGEFKFGSLVKLYNYNLQPGLKTNIKLDLYYRLSLLLPNLALPIMLYERRPYRADAYEAILSGLSVRLFDDRANNIEDGFPTSGNFSVLNQSLKYQIYAFQSGKRNRYSKSDGVVFTFNGQMLALSIKAFLNEDQLVCNI